MFTTTRPPSKMRDALLDRALGGDEVDQRLRQTPVDELRADGLLRAGELRDVVLLPPAASSGSA